MFVDDELGFKKLTGDNWRQPDAVWGIFWRAESDPVQAWVEDFIAINLSPNVPLQIRQLYEVAKSAFVYGVLCYPLLTLGAEQVCRVTEAAVSLKYRLLKAPARKGTRFSHKIGWLLENGFIRKEDEVLWRAFVSLRNLASHPDIQQIQTPAMCLRTLQTAAELINELFGPVNP